MSIRKALWSLMLACLAGLLIITPALAFPPLPSSFYGQVKVDGKNVPDGTVVHALIGGKVYAEARTQTYEGNSVFSLDVPGDDSTTDAIEGGKEGDTIQFEVGGAPASQTGTWHSGNNVNLNLTVKAGGPLQTPPPTLTPIPTQTPILAAAPLNPQPTQLAAVATTKSASNPSSLSSVLIGLVAVLLVGGGLWAFLSRKNVK